MPEIPEKIIEKLVKSLGKAKAHYVHGVTSPGEAEEILKAGLRPGSSVAKSYGWDYPINLHLEHPDEVKTVAHHPDHYTTTGGAKVLGLDIDSQQFDSSKASKKYVDALEKELEDHISVREKLHGIKTSDPKWHEIMESNPEYVKKSNRLFKAWDRHDALIEHERSSGGSFEERLDKLKALAKQLGVPVRVLMMLGALNKEAALSGHDERYENESTSNEVTRSGEWS